MKTFHSNQSIHVALLIVVLLSIALIPSVEAIKLEGNYTLSPRSGLLTLGKGSFSGTVNGTYISHHTNSTITGVNEIFLIPTTGLELNESELNLTNPNSSIPGLKHYLTPLTLDVKASILLWDNISAIFSGNYPIVATGFLTMNNHTVFMNYMPGNLSIKSSGKVNSTVLLKDYTVVVNGTEMVSGDYAVLLLNGTSCQSIHNSLFNFLTVEGDVRIWVKDAAQEEFNRFVDSFQYNIEAFMRNKESASNESIPFLLEPLSQPTSRGNNTGDNLSTPLDESPLKLDLASNLRDIAPIANGLVLIINADGTIASEGHTVSMSSFAFLRSEKMEVTITTDTSQITVKTHGDVKFAFVDTAFLGPEFRSFYLLVLFLWSGAVLTYVLFPERRHRNSSRDEDYASYARVVRWVVLALSFFLWDRAVGNMFGFSLLPILKEILTGNGPVEEGFSNHLIAIGLLFLIELGPWTFLTFAVGIPLSFIGRTIGKRLGYRRVGKYFGKSLKHASVYIFGISYITLVLNIAISKLLSSGFMPRF